MRITMSSKQYTMAMKLRAVRTLTQSDLSDYLQPTASSMARRGWITAELNDKTGEVEFRVTPALNAALSQFGGEDIMRSNPSDTLSQYLERYIKRSQRTSSRSSARSEGRAEARAAL